VGSEMCIRDRPFAKTFKAYGYDFYKVDPGLFAPAVLTMINLRTGKSFRFGHFSPDVLQESFGESNVLPS
jgi:methenyltetrahydromethanopterin cyclohydrolase